MAKKSTKKASKKTAKKVTKKVAKKTAPVKKAAKKVAKKTPAKSAVKSAAPSPALPKVGSPAPAFSLPCSQNRTISLADFAGKTLVLYFYPRADTPGCTVEACGFRDAIASYGKINAHVLGVSPDPVKDVTKFATKFKLNFPLLADEHHAICQAYGVWVQKSMYGKTYMGAARTTFIIKNGLISHVIEKVSPDGHESEVLKLLSA